MQLPSGSRAPARGRILGPERPDGRTGAGIPSRRNNAQPVTKTSMRPVHSGAWRRTCTGLAAHEEIVWPSTQGMCRYDVHGAFDRDPEISALMAIMKSAGPFRVDGNLVPRG